MAKHPGGRPLKYDSPEAMQEKIDRYFDSCKGHIAFDPDGHPIIDKHGHPVMIGEKPLTITGLALSLGMTRRSLLNYKRRPAFARVVTRARLKVECYTEERLFDRNGYSGARFVLETCFGWKEPAPEEHRPPCAVVVIHP